MTEAIPAAKMPAEIAKAIVKVMGGIKKLGKTERNQFDKYDFVSIDKFLEQVNPLCAEAGLIILQDEIKREVLPGKNNTPWLHFDFEFWLAHETGAFWDKPLHRGVMVPANGAQAFGSAQSYALKQFQRSLFQIPTGDKDDADYGKAEELPHGAQGGRAEPAKSKADSRETYERLSQANRKLEGLDAFNKFWTQTSVKTALASLPADWRKQIEAEQSDKAAELEERAALIEEEFPGDLSSPENLMAAG